MRVWEAQGGRGRGRRGRGRGAPLPGGSAPCRGALRGRGDALLPTTACRPLSCALQTTRPGDGALGPRGTHV